MSLIHGKELAITLICCWSCYWKKKKMKNDLFEPGHNGLFRLRFHFNCLDSGQFTARGGGGLNITVRKKSLYSHSQFPLYSALHTSLVSILQTPLPIHSLLPPFYTRLSLQTPSMLSAGVIALNRLCSIWWPRTGGGGANIKNWPDIKWYFLFLFIASKSGYKTFLYFIYGPIFSLFSLSFSELFCCFFSHSQYLYSSSFLFIFLCLF